MDRDVFINIVLACLGALLGLASGWVRAIVVESVRHPLKKTRLESGNDGGIKSVTT